MCLLEMFSPTTFCLMKFAVAGDFRHHLPLVYWLMNLRDLPMTRFLLRDSKYVIAPPAAGIEKKPGLVRGQKRGLDQRDRVYLLLANGVLQYILVPGLANQCHEAAAEMPLA